jgi:tripartite-type tricarboxylate transporter receptor subunit TctC
MKASVRKAATLRRPAAPRNNDRRVLGPHPRRRFLRLVAGTAALLPASRIGWAQAYPTRPVRIIVGFAPGGGTDVLARVIGQWLSERLGQPFLIENRTGAASNIAAEAVIKARADGYTILMCGMTNAINETLYDKLNFTFQRDIAPVAGVMRAPQVIDVNSSSPVKTLPEFIAYAKANPGKLIMGQAASEPRNTQPESCSR